MAKTAALVALSIIALGFGVPAICIYYCVHQGFNIILAGIIAIIALAMAGVIGFFGIIMRPLGQLEPGGISSSEREKLNMLRAHQRATLEELDDIIAILKEIRDVLRAAQE